jgi:hypothetical protein
LTEVENDFVWCCVTQGFSDLSELPKWVIFQQICLSFEFVGFLLGLAELLGFGYQKVVESIGLEHSRRTNEIRRESRKE